MFDNPNNSLDSSLTQAYKIAEDITTLVKPDQNLDSGILLPKKDPLEGKTIGYNNRYLLQTLLGQGGMSKVYRALDTKFKNRVVAIKLMTNYAPTQKKRLIKRFLREVKTIYLLKHPNIVQIFDCGITPEEAPFYGVPFYVMEYLTGKTFQSLLRQNNKIPLNELLNIIRQVCAGLKEAHSKDIVHRDLKPENIFLVRGDTFSDCVKIIDFGIAKNLISDDTKLTKTGAFIGTYRYASPEQCRGLPNIDQRSDIYSLGIILYEAICGKNPYNLDEDFSLSQADWIACHIKVPPQPLQKQPGCENLPDELAKIVMQCLAKLPQERLSDIDEIPEALANTFTVRISLNNDLGINPQASIKEENNSYDLKIKSKAKPILSTTLSTAAVKTKKDLGINPQASIKAENNSYDLKIKSEAKPILSTAVVETREDSSRSEPKKLSFGLLAVLTTCLMAIVGMAGYLGASLLLVKPPKIANSSNLENKQEATIHSDNIGITLQELENLYEQQKYQQCYQIATESPNQDNFVIKRWIGKCGLAAAKAKAEINSFSGAIAIAQTIPKTVSNYQEIQDNINIWSENILEYATKIYHQGNLEAAIKIANIIPDNTDLKAKIPEIISQWEQEEAQHQAIIDQAQQLLDQGQWYAAKQEVAKIPTKFIVWREIAQPILDQANQKIKLAEAEKRRRYRPAPRPKAKTTPAIRPRVKVAPRPRAKTVPRRCAIAKAIACSRK